MKKNETPSCHRAVDLTEKRVLQITLDKSDLEYFDACARIRNVALRSLLRRLMKVIARDVMVGGILDDEDELRRRAKGEHRYKPGAAA